MEEILSVDYLREDTLAGFLMRSLSRLIIPEEIFITTDGYHYESVLDTVSAGLNVRIRRQRCLFHIEKDMAHRIKDSHRENDLDMARKLIKYMFLQNEKNLMNLGKNSEPVRRLTEGRPEREIVEIMLDKIRSLYGGDMIISGFLSFVRKHMKEAFL